jgi:hypothetical protein
MRQGAGKTVEKFQDVKAAFGDGTNNTDVIAFTADTTPRNVALPTAWRKQFVRIRPIGANLQYYFSSSPAAAVVAAVPTATGQQAATLGESVASGVTLTVVIPDVGPNVYFVWVCDAAGAGVFLTKGSGIPGINVGEGR